MPEGQTQTTQTQLAPHQRARLEAEKAVVEKLAIELKRDGNLKKLAAMLDISIDMPQDNKEYRRIAEELIANRKFSIVDKKSGKPAEISIKSLDDLLEGSTEEERKKVTNGAVSFDELFPDAKRRDKIAAAIGDSVQEETWLLGTNVGALIAAIIGMFTGQNFFEVLTRETANSIARSTQQKLSAEGMGIDSKTAADIADDVRTSILVEKGYRKDLKKPEKLEDISLLPATVIAPTLVVPTITTPQAPTPPAAAPATVTTQVPTPPAVKPTAKGKPNKITTPPTVKPTITEQPKVTPPPAGAVPATAPTPQSSGLREMVTKMVDNLTDPSIKGNERKIVVTEATEVLLKVFKDPKNYTTQGGFFSTGLLASAGANELLKPERRNEDLTTVEGRVARRIRKEAADKSGKPIGVISNTAIIDTRPKGKDGKEEPSLLEKIDAELTRNIKDLQLALEQEKALAANEQQKTGKPQQTSFNIGAMDKAFFEKISGTCKDLSNGCSVSPNGSGQGGTGLVIGA